MKLRLVSLALLFAASGFGAYYLGSIAAQFANDTPPQIPRDAVIDGLAVDLASLDLGEVREQADYPYQFAIQNRNNAPTEIFDIAVSCSCVEGVEPRALTLEPGATATIRLKLNLVKRNYGQQELARRPFEVAIHPILKARGQQPLAWNLHGVIKSYVTLSTAFLDFGEVPVRGKAPVYRKVTATVHDADARLESTVEPNALATVDIRPVKGSANQFDVLVAPDPNLPVGVFSGNVHVELKTKDGQRLPGVVLPVAGKMQPEVRAIPAQLAFGPRKVGQEAESTVTLQVPPGKNWVVDHIETDSPDLRVEAIADPGASANRVFRIRQQVTKTGHQVSAVRFLVRKDNGEPVPLSMAVAYDGDADGVISEPKEQGAER